MYNVIRVQDVDQPLQNPPVIGLDKSCNVFELDNVRQSRSYHVDRTLQKIAASKAVGPAFLFAQERERLAWEAGHHDFALGARNDASISHRFPEVDPVEIEFQKQVRAVLSISYAMCETNKRKPFAAIAGTSIPAKSLIS